MLWYLLKSRSSIHYFKTPRLVNKFSKLLKELILTEKEQVFILR